MLRTGPEIFREAKMPIFNHCFHSSIWYCKKSNGYFVFETSSQIVTARLKVSSLGHSS